jgi:hypothetical protein
MNNLVRFGVFVFLFLVAGSRIGLAQRFDYEDKVHFADSVKRIKMWTYVEGDRSFRRYQDALKAATIALNDKGYQVDVIAYEIGKGISAQEWENKIISDLKKDEAFLELSTQIRKNESIGRAIPSGSVITNEKGVVIFSQDWHDVTDSGQTNYTSKAFLKMFVNWNIPLRSSLVPVYSKVKSLESTNIYSAVTYTTSGIPVSKHPVVTMKSDTLKAIKVPIEIQVFGGYTFSSKMDVIEQSTPNNLHSANFGGNVHYGLEIGLGISKSMDLFISYQRMGELVNVNTPRQEKVGSVTINSNYMLAGTNYNFRINKLISPYIGVSLGSLNMVPSDSFYIDFWYFIVGAQGGVKFYFSKRIGLNIRAEVLYQVHPTRAPFLYSDDIYHNTPVSAMSNMIQVGVSGGFIIRLGN